jgi:hypothetical protein
MQAGFAYAPKERLNQPVGAALLARREKHPECCGMYNAETPDAVT